MEETAFDCQRIRVDVVTDSGSVWQMFPGKTFHAVIHLQGGEVVIISGQSHGGSGDKARAATEKDFVDRSGLAKKIFC